MADRRKCFACRRFGPRNCSPFSRAKMETTPPPARGGSVEEFERLLELVRHKPVQFKSLEEAWTFVNACRASGQTLDLLIDGGQSLDVAEAVFPYLEPELFPAVSATATLRMAGGGP